MIFGIAVGDPNGLLVAVGDIGATERKTGGVEMMEALRNAFVVTDGEGQFAKQHITAISLDLIERPTELKAIEHLRLDTLTKEQIEGFIGKKLGGQGQGLISKA